jgi:uncharacterized membrane protein YbaN (DUF454 family)
MDVRKALLIFFGTVFVGLGVLGMFLPLVPTTVFLLLAAYCYSRSSERFHNWLLTNRWCGKYIKDYQEGKGMTAAHKVKAILLLWASIGFSIWAVGGRLWLTLLLVAIAAGVTAHLLWIKTYNREKGEVPVEDPANI